MDFLEKRQREIEILRNGGVGVIPTDTIYGIVGSAFSKEAVDRIYTLRKRDRSKSLIILFSEYKDLECFGIPDLDKYWAKLGELWEEKPTSIVLPINCSLDVYKERTEGAFRLPKNVHIREFLSKTGPLVAPSANLSGEKPASSVEEAKSYFGDKVDFYIDGGELNNKSSRLIEFNNGEISILRD